MAAAGAPLRGEDRGAFLLAGLTYGVAVKELTSTEDAVTAVTDSVKSMSGYCSPGPTSECCRPPASTSSSSPARPCGPWSVPSSASATPRSRRRLGAAGAFRGPPFCAIEAQTHCARELPMFAVPRYIETVPSLPLTETGKVRKAVLRERGVTAATWDRTADAPAKA